MKVYLVKRLSLLGLVVCCLQMGSVHAAKVSGNLEAFNKRLDRPENKTRLNDIYINLIGRHSEEAPGVVAAYDTALLFETEGLIKGIFPDISPAALQKAADMRDLLISFETYKFQQFSGDMQLAFIAIVNKLAKLKEASFDKNASAKMKQLKALSKKLNAMTIVEPVD